LLRRSWNEHGADQCSEDAFSELASAVREARVKKAEIGWELEDIEAAVLDANEPDSDDESEQEDSDDE
jgi:hypothetical protein